MSSASASYDIQRYLFGSAIIGSTMLLPSKAESGQYRGTSRLAHGRLPAASQVPRVPKSGFVDVSIQRGFSLAQLPLGRALSKIVTVGS